MAIKDDILGRIHDAVGWGKVPDAFTIITNLGSALEPLLFLTAAAAYAFGAWLALFGLWKLKKAGEEQGNAVGDYSLQGVVCILLGVTLVYLIPTVNSLTMTAFGDGSHNPFGYTTPDGMAEKVATAMAVIYRFIGIVGIMAVIRGLLIFKGTTEGNNNDTIAKGWWHLIGGVCAVHLDTLISAFKSTAGF